MKLLDKVSVVTGASRGIGRAIALEFAKEGADIVVVVDRDIDGAQKVVDEIRSMGREGLIVKADVSKRSEVDKVVQKALEKFGKIDVLVNNAGVSQVSPSVELSEDEWSHVIGVNLSGVFFCCQAVGKEMIKQRRGKIINISSISGVAAYPMRAAYCSTKAAVIMLTKVLAIEWAKYNIQVNAIAPGYVETSLVLNLISKGLLDLKALERRIPMGRLAKPDEIAKVAIFLASDDCSYITGETIFIDGGWTAYGYL